MVLSSRVDARAPPRPLPLLYVHPGHTGKYGYTYYSIWKNGCYIQKHINTAEINIFFVHHELSVIELRTRLHMMNKLYS